MRNITFTYSTDGGSSFTGVTLACNVVRCTLMPTSETAAAEEPSMTSDAPECQIMTPRLHVDIQVSSIGLNPRDTAAGTSNFIALQKWVCAPLRRIYNADVATAATIDGWNQFDTNNNTNYVNMRDDPSYEFEDKDDASRRIRKATLNLKTRKAVSL